MKGINHSIEWAADVLVCPYLTFIKATRFLSRSAIILIASLLLIPIISRADVTYPLAQFPFSLDYKLAYQTAVSTGNINLLSPVGPYYHSSLAEILSQYRPSPAMEIIGDVSETDIRLYSIITEKIKTERSLKTQDLFSIIGGARCQPSKHFGALILFSLDRAKAIDPDYTGKEWRGLAGDIETSAIYYKNNGLDLTLGRQRVFWGPQPINLILSENAEPLDMFSAGYRKGRLWFNFIIARLDKSRPDSIDYIRFPNYTFNDNRYLAGHRLDINIFRNFRLGLFETSLFGGEGRSIELYYLNPLHFFHAIQLNENVDDNTILGLDFTYLPSPGFSIYGQLLVDDFQIDRKSQGDQEPDEIGLLAGLFKSGKPGSSSPDIKLEYTKITNRTYHQIMPRNRYLYRNKLLGHPLGPDSDSLSIMFRFWPDTRMYVELESAFCRHGEGSIYNSWDQPWLEMEGDYNEPFPTGIVEKSISVAVRTAGYMPFSEYTSQHLFVMLECGYRKFTNRYNISGENTSTAWLNFSLSWTGSHEIGFE